jgi:[acyl-carrier-protein] S-malonyltransferase
MRLHAQSSAFLFPGQGVVPRDICAYYSFLRELDSQQTEEYIKVMQIAMDEVNPEAHFRIGSVITDEKSPAFQKTSFVQPVTYMLSILTQILLQKMTDCPYEPDFMLGHSLGALSALTAAGSLSFDQGSRVVVARSKYMQEACEESDTGLFVVLGLTEEKISKICKNTGSVIALINAPTAFVIGGKRSIFSSLMQEAVTQGARKAFPLEASGAFHTNAMKSAYNKFRKFFFTFSLQVPNVSVVTNLFGLATQDPEKIKSDVVESIIRPVNWMRMMNFLRDSSVSAYVEVGPGTTLTSLGRINGIPREQAVHAQAILA